MYYIEKNNLGVRELVEKDAPLLLKWLTDDHVLQYYEGRDQVFTLESIQENFFQVEQDVHRCLIEYDSHDIGYIQFYQLSQEEKQTFGYMNEIVYGCDQFIGDTTYWNKGIGQVLVKEMARYLTKERMADIVIMDPQTWNERAIACYEKCGFRKVRLLPKQEWHEGEFRDCWLMEYRR